MKKIRFLCGCFLAFSSLSICLYLNSQAKVLFLNMDNIEALAQGESSECVWSGKDEGKKTRQEKIPMGGGSPMCVVYERTTEYCYCYGYLEGNVCCTPYEIQGPRTEKGTCLCD